MAKSKTYSKGKGSGSDRRLEDLEEQLAKGISEGKSAESLKKIQDAIDEINNNLKKSIANIDEFSSGVQSLGVFVGKSNKLFQAMNSLSDGMSVSMKSISDVMSGPALSGATNFKKQVVKTTDAYKGLGNAIAVNTKKLVKQQITQSQYNQAILDGYEDMEEQLDRLKGQMEGMTAAQLRSAQVVKRTLENEKERLKAFAAAAEKSKKNLEGMGFALETAASAGIPAMSELSGVITKAAEGGMGLALAFAALGAALGKMVYDLGFFGDKLGTIASYDKKLAGLKGQIDAINQQVTLGIFGGRNFVKESAILDFSNTVTQMGIEFEAASKTALFGEKLGGVGYGAAQLQMAGIAAETIATAMKDASSTMGSNVSGEFGADMALLAARTGQTSEGIASITDTFMRLGNVSAETAINLEEGLRTMAKQANVNLGALMEDVAEASKDALSYQLKSPAALAKAATFAASLGVKFKTIADAGRNMVLNYKDSIKAEMSLSAMLGRRVDLSQVRALFAAGRPEDALRALKSQGLDPSTMSIFAQESLKSALGGMSLDDIQKVTGVKTKQDFLNNPDAQEEFFDYWDNILKIKITGINANPIPLPFGNHGKIYFNILLDDRAGLSQSIDILNKLIDKIVDSNDDIDKQEVEMIKFKILVNGYLEQKNYRKLDSEQLFIRKKIDETVREIQQLENNIGFISNVSEDNPLVQNVRKQIDVYKEKLDSWKVKLNYLKELDS